MVKLALEILVLLVVAFIIIKGAHFQRLVGFGVLTAVISDSAALDLARREGVISLKQAAVFVPIVDGALLVVAIWAAVRFGRLTTWAYAALTSLGIEVFVQVLSAPPFENHNQALAATDTIASLMVIVTLAIDTFMHVLDERAEGVRISANEGLKF
jgi:hypothetical protein